MREVAGLAAQVESRARRGLELWLSRRSGMEAQGDGVWLVPSESSPGSRHRVSLLEETCTCRSFLFSGLRCKHRWAVEFELVLLSALAELAGEDHPCAPGAHREGFGRRPSR